MGKIKILFCVKINRNVINVMSRDFEQCEKPMNIFLWNTVAIIVLISGLSRNFDQ